MAEAGNGKKSSVIFDSQRVRIALAGVGGDHGDTARFEVETDGARRVEVAMLAGGGWTVTISPPTEPT